jgi:hypothetical protein
MKMSLLQALGEKLSVDKMLVDEMSVNDLTSHMLYVT